MSALDTSFEAALEGFRLEYVIAVNRYAEFVRDAVSIGAIKATREAVDTKLIRLVGNSFWTSDLTRARVVALVSENAVHAFNGRIVENGRIQWASIACAAMELDVWVRLKAVGLRVDPETETVTLEVQK